MFLNGLYHMRRVPREMDGRTDAEKQDPNYREYLSLYYEIDDDLMFLGARVLRDAGFDCRMAVLNVLNKGKSFNP